MLISTRIIPRGISSRIDDIGSIRSNMPYSCMACGVSSRSSIWRERRESVYSVSAISLPVSISSGTDKISSPNPLSQWFARKMFPCPIESSTEWTLFRWNYLIYYCFAVVFLKACLQVGLELGSESEKLVGDSKQRWREMRISRWLPVWVFSPLNVLCNRSLPLLVSNQAFKDSTITVILTP